MRDFRDAKVMAHALRDALKVKTLERPAKELVGCSRFSVQGLQGRRLRVFELAYAIVHPRDLRVSGAQFVQQH
jgi:hypothetical protein